MSASSEVEMPKSEVLTEVPAAPKVARGKWERPTDPGWWNKHIDGEKEYDRIANEIAKARGPALSQVVEPDSVLLRTDDKRVPLLNWEAMLVGLTNGLRAVEVVRVMTHWVETGERTFYFVMAKKPVPCLCSHARASRDKTKAHEAKMGKCRVEGCTCEAYRPNLSKQPKEKCGIPDELLDEDRAMLKEVMLGKWKRKVSGVGGFTVDSYKHWCKRHGGFNSHSVRYHDMSAVGKITGNVGMNALVTRHSEQEVKVYQDREEAWRIRQRLIYRKRDEAPSQTNGATS